MALKVINSITLIAKKYERGERQRHANLAVSNVCAYVLECEVDYDLAYELLEFDIEYATDSASVGNDPHEWKPNILYAWDFS